MYLIDHILRKWSLSIIPISSSQLLLEIVFQEFLLKNLNWKDVLTKELSQLLTAHYMLLCENPSEKLQPQR